MDNRWERAMLANKVEKINERVKKIDERVDKIETELTEIMPQKTVQIAIGSADGFLPDHLEKTKRTIELLGVATASDVSKVTKRARAVESAYLCQLERIGLLTGERAGRQKKFRLVTKPLLSAIEPLEMDPQISQH